MSLVKIKYSFQTRKASPLEKKYNTALAVTNTVQLSQHQLLQTTSPSRRRGGAPFKIVPNLWSKVLGNVLMTHAGVATNGRCIMCTSLVS